MINRESETTEIKWGFAQTSFEGLQFEQLLLVNVHCGNPVWKHLLQEKLVLHCSWQVTGRKNEKLIIFWINLKPKEIKTIDYNKINQITSTQQISVLESALKKAKLENQAAAIAETNIQTIIPALHAIISSIDKDWKNITDKSPKII